MVGVGSVAEENRHAIGGSCQLVASQEDRNSRVFVNGAAVCLH